MVRKPPWARDEIILALALYKKLDFAHSAGRFNQQSPEILELSRTLNRLGIHEESELASDFRNANGVYMKLCNFLALDDAYAGTGLQANSKTDRDVWVDLADDPERLQRLATAIEKNLPREGESPLPIDDEDEEASEGRLLLARHVRRERSRVLRNKKVQRVLRELGRLPCEVCGFVFQERYGELGRGFIECHHRVPLAELDPDVPTRLSDLVLVCANCHRMLHRGNTPPTLKGLSEQLL